MANHRSSGPRGLLAGLAAVLATAGAPAAGDAPVRHDLEVGLAPAEQRLEVVDRVSWAAPPDEPPAFLLHEGLAPRAGEGWRLEPAGELPATLAAQAAAADVPVRGWRLLPEAAGQRTAEIRYGGVLHHPLETAGEEYQRGFAETPGLIGSEGVFLAGSSFWVPLFGDGLVRFELTVRDLPEGWEALTQGARRPAGEGERRWRSDAPQEEIYLVAGPWTEYTRESGGRTVRALLREPDPGLAHRYLEATERYLQLYEGLLGEHPYPSFALVENFWDTGYGMPGFTLLGPRIIRMPWILTSSFPHEILHDWWGNGVYVDLEQGNWSEGLTAYMADHLFAEQRGEGERHRRTTLQKYTDFVRGGGDLPLAEFRARHSAASEAVGYGKALMVFHMARQRAGDEAFVDALARFAAQHRHERASWNDLAAAFREATDRDWTRFFAPWVERPGAPLLKLAAVDVRPVAQGEGFVLSVTVRQRQPEAPFPLSVPVAVTLPGAAPAEVHRLPLPGREATLEIPVPARPLRVDVDPAFDVMRRVDPRELPAAISTLMGAEAPLFVLPAAASAAEREAWAVLAQRWSGGKAPRLATDEELAELPEGPVWVLGRANALRGAVFDALGGQHPVQLEGDELALAGERLPLAERSALVVARRADDPAQAVGWISAGPAEAIAGLARKLPHYTRYSYLGFRGPEPENVLKGSWSPQGSPLSRTLVDGEGAPPPLILPPRRPLAEPPPAFDVARMRSTVGQLAAERMEGRGLGTEGLAAATDLVARELGQLDLEPAGAEGFRQNWRWTGGEPPRPIVLTNLLARRPGTDPALAPVLVLAHLDHLGRGWPADRAASRGEIHPGADDNASGVAVLLELARKLAGAPPARRPVLFAVTTGEEAGLLGARHLLETLPEADQPYACLNLDTVGRLEGDELLVIGAGSAREWPFIFRGVQHVTGIPVATVSEPLDSSDQVVCIERGIPGVQLFTGPHADYHRPSDTPEKIDAEGMVAVATVAGEVVRYLADREEPLSAAAVAPGQQPAAAATGRKVSLGTVPDFAHPGAGVRVEDVLPGSPAEQAGLRAGDVLLAIDGESLAGLRDLSRVLKAHEPGDRVRLTVDRDGERLTLAATLAQR
jgi:hypothetical protein